MATDHPVAWSLNKCQTLINFPQILLQSCSSLDKSHVLQGEYSCGVYRSSQSILVIIAHYNGKLVINGKK